MICLQEAELRALIGERDTPLALIDCDVVRARYRQLQAALPGVGLHYAIKSLPDLEVVRALQREGAGFDVATSGEIDLLRQAHVGGQSCIHTHPIKKDREIRAALRYGCTTFVVDNPDELRKFLPYQHRVGLLLRVSFRASDAVVDLSRKFGCNAEDAPAMLAEAARLGLHFKGLSFHVGSQCGSPAAHVQAIRHCRRLLEMPPLFGQSPMRILDIGGGFPVDYGSGDVDIDAFCAPIRAELELLPPNIEVLAEPGRFISAPALHAISRVVGRAERDGRRWYYLDDGVYGLFSGQVYDHAHYPLHTFRTGPTRASVLAGPTCDSIDVIAEDIELPELEIGDLVVGRMMGAYTLASATEFNSLAKPSVLHLNAVAMPDMVVDFPLP